jgi:hypothetical protein
MALHVVDGHFNNLDLTNSVRVSLVKITFLIRPDFKHTEIVKYYLNFPHKRGLSLVTPDFNFTEIVKYYS